MNSLVETLSYWKPNPIAFTIKIGDLSLDIAWYGIFISIGFIAAIVFAAIKLHFWYKVSYDPFLFFCIIGIPVSILGGRLWSFIIGDTKLGPGDNFFIEFWHIRSGGMAIQGAILATVIAAGIWFPIILRKPKYNVKTYNSETNNHIVKQVSMWVYADAIIPCILMGQIIGRWGNFFNQELYGATISEKDLLWLKNVMPKVFEGMFINGEFKQPLFLYESFANFWFFLIIYVGCEFISFRKAGDLGFLYFLFYGILRLIMEPFRDNQFQHLTSIITSVLFIVFSVFGIILNHFVLSRNREFKILELVLKWLSFYLILWMFPKKRSEHTAYHTYGFKNRFVFKRSETEMLYYNGY